MGALHALIVRLNSWQLSPAYDLNLIPLSHGFHLNITDTDNRIDFKLPFEVANFFQLTQSKTTKIFDEVLLSVKTW